MNKVDIFHPNAKGTGSALSVEVHPAKVDFGGKVLLSFIAQMPYEGETVFPRFDYGNRITISLDPLEVEKLLEVFEGQTESIEDGKGFFIVSTASRTSFKCRHILYPATGYALTVKVERTTEGEVTETRSSTFTLTPSEGGMLYHGLRATMGLLLFGE